MCLPLPPQHMREAAERRQQLELEHEQALAILNAKQQEIDLLQKVSWGWGGGPVFAHLAFVKAAV